MEFRIRTVNNVPEIRDNRRLSWYAAVYSQPSFVTDRVPSGERMRHTEVILPGAFDSSLSGQGEIIATIDHDKSRTFASRSTGELLLQSDPHGLYASVYLPKTDLGDQILKDAESGKLVGGSFRSRLTATGDQWHQDGGQWRCEVVEAPLEDVCVTGIPAYHGTSIRVRTDKEKMYQDFFRRLRLIKLKRNT